MVHQVDVIILLNLVLLGIVLWMVHSGYHPLKHRPLGIVLVWCTVVIILLRNFFLGLCLA